MKRGKLVQLTGVEKISNAVGQSDYNALVAIQKATVQPQLGTACLFMFVLCAFAYLIAWGIMKGLVPRHKLITDL
jgi:hypothetical protein